MRVSVISGAKHRGPIITQRQAWSGLQFASSTSSALAYASQPIAGSLLIAFAGASTASFPVTITDNIGDGVDWIEVVGPAIRSTNQERVYYKVVGTPSGAGKTVTQTKTVASVSALYITEFAADRPVTWAVNGTPVTVSNTTAANPTAGNITTTIYPTVIVGGVEKSSADPTPGVGYVGYESGGTAWFSSALWVEHKIQYSAGVQTPNWIAASSTFCAMAAAFSATGV